MIHSTGIGKNLYGDINSQGTRHNCIFHREMKWNQGVISGVLFYQNGRTPRIPLFQAFATTLPQI